MKLEVDIRKKLGSFVLDTSFTSIDHITGLLGSSGCGKSLTLKCIAGIEKPDEGRIVLDGRVLFDSEQKINIKPQDRKVGYLFQSYALFPTMNVRRNIMTGLNKVKDRNENERKYREVIALLDLEGLEEHKPHQLSGGQQQRVALARMLVSDPVLLLFDEPFSALDTALRETLQPQIKGLIDRIGKQAVLVTHSQSEALRLCDSVSIMDNGSIIRKGSTEAVFSSPQNEAAARLTGYRNITKAVRQDGHHLILPDWKLELTCDIDIPEGVTAIALRPDAFYEDGEFLIVKEEVFRDLGGNILVFRFKGMDRSCDVIWAECGECSKLGIKTSAIVFLF